MNAVIVCPTGVCSRVPVIIGFLGLHISITYTVHNRSAGFDVFHFQITMCQVPYISLSQWTKPLIYPQKFVLQKNLAQYSNLWHK